jgi:Glucose/sorbosone dehydrogenases
VKREEISSILLVGRIAHQGCSADDAAESESIKPAVVDEKVDTGEEPDPDTPVHTYTEELADEPAEPVVLADNLQIPWSIEIFGDVFYLTERPGSIFKIENDALERQSVELKQELSTAAEAGLLGFVLAPDFAQTNLAFAYYTYQDGSRPLNRIVTLRLGKGKSGRRIRCLSTASPAAEYTMGGD